MHEMTKKNLEAAFAGESMAHIKYLAFADKAEKDGKVNIAKMFRAIAYAEQVHATNHLKVLMGVGTTPENLQKAIDGENFEVAEMYAVYDVDAKFQGEKDAEKSIHYAIEAEKIHSAMYTKAKKSADANKDIELGSMYICPICGYTHEGEPHDNCPVCKAKKEIFKKF
ncbi:MAG: rubrerythrin family protein [Candidatus Omnitrophica bacterium]|nr:rubrerythrin family protein [Candidatus Omnitrophota bacterium]